MAKRDLAVPNTDERETLRLATLCGILQGATEHATISCAGLDARTPQDFGPALAYAGVILDAQEAALVCEDAALALSQYLNKRAQDILDELPGRKGAPVT